MKKYFILFLILYCIGSVFSEDKNLKMSFTEDFYPVGIYQIEDSEYEYCVKLVSDETKECFIWFFHNLSESMEHFKWLSSITVVKTERIVENAEGYAYLVLFRVITLEEAREMIENEDVIIKKFDKKDDWMRYSFNAYFLEDYIIYCIDKDKQKNNYEPWR